MPYLATWQVCVVTGGSGFIGRAVVKQLLADSAGYRLIRIFDLAPTFAVKTDEADVQAAMESGRIEYVQGDIRDKVKVVEGQ